MKKILIGLLISVTLVGCMGYVPGEQSYWDAQVREMCEKDGRVQIFERVSISKQELDGMLRTGEGVISLKMKDSAKIEDTVYLESSETNIREGIPRVRRTEWLAVRRADKKVVARWYSYGRIGGDIPTGLNMIRHYGVQTGRKRGLNYGIYLL